ncbi:hypothetical protein K8089_02255 [Aequorivita sp. F47161]|uniref:Secreted protein n=1 Tax=Aequorivita vitellina TaxID=2874475 RepID=A0A9X1U1T1_9FLAO|nr:hypothetical protein [Aequorivita vitellina]MCG2417828.1 hypothetical protein [Aequorivita vitellina]MCZ4318365.1 hypothetical protein [Aequorivita viscosa]
MKSFFHKSISIALATLVLFTTMSFTVDMHYCGDALVDFSVVQNVKTCGMEKSESENNCENTIPDDSCCSDKQVVIEGQDELKLSFDTLSFEQQTFVATFFYSYLNLFEGFDSNIIPFKNYNPPFLIRDIQKLHETYLI